MLTSEGHDRCRLSYTLSREYTVMLLNSNGLLVNTIASYRPRALLTNLCRTRS